MVWIGDEPGKRVSVLAESLEDASEKLNTEFGAGNVFDLHNEDDAQRPRQVAATPDLTSRLT